MEREIFISYSRKDLKQVTEIKNEIEKSTGVDCWMDLNAIETGATRFTQDLVNGIKSCRVFLFMLSEESQNSIFALRELNFAMKRAEKEEEKKKHVVIINIDNCTLTDEFELMYGLTDSITWNNISQRSKFLRDIKSWLSENMQSESEAQHDESVFPIDTINQSRRQGIKHIISDKVFWWFILSLIIIFIIIIFIRNRSYREVQIIETEKWLTPINDTRSNLWGYVNKSGGVKIPCQWKNALSFSDGLAPVQISDGNWGYIDYNGKLVFNRKWMKSEEFSEGLAVVQKNENSWGYIDTTGSEVIPCNWTFAKSFSEGYACVRKSNNRYVYLNHEGIVVFSNEWLEAEPFSEGLAAVKDSYWGYIDTTGTRIFGGGWYSASSFSDGYAVICDRRSSYDYGYYYDYMFINHSGEVVFNNSRWNEALPFSEGLAAVKDSYWGYIDTTGTEVIECKWQYAYPFSEGLARVKNDNKWGYIDKKGEIFFPCIWEDASDFYDGIAIVKDYEKQWWLIDKTMRVIGEVK